MNSMTPRAASTGLRAYVVTATAPAAPASGHHRGVEFRCPQSVSAAPCPALNSGLSSSSTTAAQHRVERGTATLQDVPAGGQRPAQALVTIGALGHRQRDVALACAAMDRQGVGRCPDRGRG